jgi:hypothetical protein
MRHKGPIGREEFSYRVFIPRPPDIDQFDFCNAIDEWLNGNDITYRGNIPEFADSWTLILLFDTEDQRRVLDWFANAGERREMPVADHFTKTSLARRGWTPRMIRDYLPAPTQHRFNPRNFDTRPGWSRAQVVHVENTVTEVCSKVVFHKLLHSMD